MKAIIKKPINYLDLISGIDPVDIAYINFEPNPLLPTYSIVHKGEEIKYSLHRNDEGKKSIDKENIYYLKRIK